MKDHAPKRGYSEGPGFFEHALEKTAEMPKEKREIRKRKSRLKSIIAVFVSLVIIFGGGYFVYAKVMNYWRANTAVDYPGPGSGEVIISVEEGWTATDIGAELADKDVVASQKAFVKAAKAEPLSSSIQVGSYKMKLQMTADDALSILIDPNNRLRNNITFREGLRNSQVASLISASTGISTDDVSSAMESGEIGLPSYASGSEGYLFPETYEFDQSPSAKQILSQMTTHFKNVAGELELVPKAEKLGYTPQEIVTIASIIEKEIRHPEQAPDVAQVIYNRLKAGMKLRMDSTVHYAVGDSGETVMTTDEQRQIDSPYNTYKYEGLPPGPICNPGKTALAAALNPSKGDYMFFVTVNIETGETRFAATEEEHSENVKMFQQYCREHDGC